VHGHRDELQQVLLNLVTNAGHAVRGLPLGAPRRVTLSVTREGNQAVLRVRDTGPGVPPHLVSQLFTPFFTTKEPGEGTGLGLSLSYRIIQAHGGRLVYQPAPGGGAEFSFTLPLAAEDSHPAAGRTAEPEVRETLLVHGDAGAELVVRALFEPAGYQVQVVKTAAEGLDRLAERPWSAVIVDGSLSADGRWLLVDQLAASPAIAKRLLVTSADPALLDRCRARGIGVLPRPFLPRDLLAAAGDLLDTVRSEK
jgi:CheY-like chemotaxis protein